MSKSILTFVLYAFCLFSAEAQPSVPAAIPASGSALPRIAILAVDNAEETQAMLDFLTVKISQGKKVDLVERSEIERVLAEQKLSAAGLAEGENRVLLGRILKADGFVFLEKDERRKVR